MGVQRAQPFAGVWGVPTNFLFLSPPAASQRALKSYWGTPPKVATKNATPRRYTVARRLGLIIGINEYQHPAFQPLQFAENDARALAQWLVNGRGGNWAPSDLQLLLGAQATPQLAEALLMQLCVNLAESGDLVFLYFAGHAFLDETSGDGYLAFTNTHYQQPATGLHLLSLVRQAMIPSRAAQIVLVLDCFQTGPIWSMRRTSPFDFKPLLGPTLQNALQQTQGRLLYCSCRGNEYAPEVGEKKVGKLLYRMIVGLSGPATDPTSGQITLQTLHTFLSGSLDEQHQPQVFGQEQRPIVLVGDMPSPAPSSLIGQEYAAASSILSSSRPVANSATVQPPTGAQLAEYPQQSSIGIASTQMSPSTSGQLSLEILEQNRKQQCTKLLNQARQMVQMQNLPGAFNTIENILQMAPDFVEALILKGQLLGATGRFQEAVPVVNQVVQLDPGNPLGWSMRAALLTNMGQLQEASSAIERSIALNPNNPEALAIRNTIQENLARNSQFEHGQKPQPATAQHGKQGGPKSFLISAAIQLLALVVGAIGASILIVQPQLPIIIAFLLESSALAILCVNAARGAYLYGAKRLLLTLVTCLLALGIVGGLYRFGYSWLTRKVIAFPPLIVPVLFLGLWLVAAAVLPLLSALGGFIARKAVGARRKG
jgi:tetratricopeptide (TPR) repeat protein